MLRKYSFNTPIVEPVTYMSLEENSLYNNIEDSDRIREASIFLFNSYLNYINTKDIHILHEGFASIKDTIINFFKKVWKKISDFIKKAKNWFKMQFMEFRKYLEEHKSELNVDTPYQVEGYEYDIDAGDIDFGPVDDVLNQAASDIKNIKKANNEEFTTILRNGPNEKTLSGIRGKLVGLNIEIDSGDFKENINRTLRGGNSYKISITVNNDKIKEFADNYIKLDDLYKKLLIEEKSMRTMFDKIVYFFEHMPSDKIEKGIKRVNIGMVSRDKFKVNKNDEFEDYTQGYYSRLVAYYTRQKDTMKDLAKIYTTLYATKIHIIAEAEKFYRKELKKAINPFNDVKDKIEKKAKEGEKND